MSLAEKSNGRPVVLLWLRNDLRLHDHEPLHTAVTDGARVVLLYCVDPRHFRTLDGGWPKTGPFRARFLIESLHALREAAREIGGELVVCSGAPEQVVPEVAASSGATHVFWHQEFAPEEHDVQREVARALERQSIQTRTFSGHTLVHQDDIPFALHEVPDTFSQYRNLVEKRGVPRVVIREPLPAPAALDTVPLPAGEIPSLQSLGLSEPAQDVRSLFSFKGGEAAARARLTRWFWNADRLRTYKTTRNGLLDTGDSSRLSPWLALGCLSPRTVYAEVRRYEAERVQNEDTQWLIFELHWRDYFRWVSARWGARLFAPGGLQGLRYPWRSLRDHDARVDFNRWAEGTTGFPLVDAAMRELSCTGYTSNRARQNVASFLTRVLGIDWRIGASWFESLLVDYDVASNWGNWAYVAGVGNDARGFRFFNVHKQALMYDAKGDFARHWLPELEHIPDARIYRPEMLSATERSQFNIALGDDYPAPMVDLFAAADASAERYARSTVTR